MKTGILAAAALTAALAVSAGGASAQSAAARFKAPAQLAGTGCPSGSARISGAGTSTLTAALRKYDAAQPASTAASGMQRTACSFALPVSVPKGQQISSLTVTWKGRAKGRTELRREYFVAGQRGPVKTSQPSGRFTEQDSLPGSLFGSCGEDLVLRINSSVRAAEPDSQIAVGGKGQSDRLTIRLKWRKCRQ